MSWIAEVQLILQGVIVILLAMSGVAKILSLHSFRRGLMRIPYVGRWWSYLIAYTLPFIEIILALCLYFQIPYTRVALVLLFTSFMGVAFFVVLKRLKIPCHCFGTDYGKYLSPETIVFNLIMITLTLASSGTSTAQSNGFIVFIVAGSFILVTLNIHKTIHNIAVVNELRRLRII